MKRQQRPNHETLDPIPGTLKSYLLTIKEHKDCFTKNKKKGRRELFNLLLRMITLITSGKGLHIISKEFQR